jgi:hypothetical protein
MCTRVARFNILFLGKRGINYQFPLVLQCKSSLIKGFGTVSDISSIHQQRVYTSEMWIIIGINGVHNSQKVSS